MAIELTDEEIIKALTLDLIHRLQAKIEGQRKIIEYQDGLPDLVEQQKAEIERLTEEKTNISQSYIEVCDINERLTEENCTLRTEIDNERRYYENAYSKVCQLENDKTELQKQVEELSKANDSKLIKILKLEEQVDESEDICLDCPYKVKFDEIEKQAVKDTVKEIIADVKNCMRCFEDDDDGYLLKKCEFEFFMREISKRKGVEVE